MLPAMQTIHELPTPALLVDLSVLERNLRRMKQRADELGVTLRPHLKTHKCVEIGKAQQALGSQGVTVSTLYEARVFAAHGFDDITWAFPLAAARAADVAELGRKLRLGVVLDDPGALDALEAAEAEVRAWIKVDCGYGRAGLDPASEELLALARRIEASPSVEFAGLLSHSGHAYHARSPYDARRIGEQERALMSGAADRLRAEGVDVPGVSTGSTPTMAHVARLDGVTEVRPGNYALYDYTQVALGACTPGDCAATVLATVVSSSPARGRAIVDAGALALSSDRGPAHARPSFGRLYEDYEGGTLRHNARLISLSQEHGIVDRPLPIGEKARILPNHSCLAIACFDVLYVVEGTSVLDMWKIWRGR
jgi:D-serine deaminase-like pyridoxal phosphate-dependent protein